MSSAEKAERGHAEPKDLNQVMDEIGMGPYQWLQLILISGVVLTDGAEILVASSLLTALKEVWHLSPMIKGLMMSTIFTGVCIGGLIGGNLADVYGRRRAILLAYFGLVTFGAGIATAQGQISMLFLSFLFGISFGSGVGPSVTILTESSPSNWRTHFVNTTNLFFAVGEVYCSILLLVIMPDLRDPDGTLWRYVQVLSVIPGCIFGILSFMFLRESPHYLLTQGREKEAIQVVQQIARFNGNEDKAEELSSLQLPTVGETSALVSSSKESGSAGGSPVTPAELQTNAFAKMKESFEVLSRKEYRGIVIGSAYLCFLGNYLFYGMTYALPQVFSHLHKEVNPARQVLYVSVSDLPGFILVCFLLYTKSMGHRDGLVILASCGAFLSLSLISIEHEKTLYCGLMAAYLIKYTAFAFFSLTYCYIGEVFPARIRASSVSICISVGRVGSMTAPLIVESMRMFKFQAFGHTFYQAPFLMLTSALCLLAVIFVRTCLHFELKNAPLQNITATPRHRIVKEGTLQPVDNAHDPLQPVPAA